MGNRPLMELLVAHSANINVQGGSEKMTALHEAVVNENSHESIIQFLLENGADPQIKYRQCLRWTSIDGSCHIEITTVKLCSISSPRRTILN